MRFGGLETRRVWRAEHKNFGIVTLTFVDLFKESTSS